MLGPRAELLSAVEIRFKDRHVLSCPYIWFAFWPRKAREGIARPLPESIIPVGGYRELSKGSAEAFIGIAATGDAQITLALVVRVMIAERMGQ